MKNTIFLAVLLSLTADINAQITDPASLYIEENFFRYIDQADSVMFLREIELPVTFLLSETEKAEFESLGSISDRREYIKIYIRRKNLNPLLSMNFWLKEFIDRSNEARHDYSIESWPYLDDRGIVFIQHGRPYRTHEDPGQVGEFTILRNESWCYYTDNGEMYIHFINRGKFKRVKSLTEASEENRLSRKANVWRSLITQRDFLGHDYAQVVDDMTNNFMRRETWQFMDEMEKKEAETIAKNPPGMREVFNRQNNFIPEQSIVCFRAPEGRIRVELTMLLPVKGLIPLYGLTPPDSLRLQFTALMRDNEFRNVGKGEYTSDVFVTPLLDSGYDCVPGGMSFTVNPDSGDVTTQIFDINKLRMGFSQADFTTRSFQSDSLMLSDIALYAEPPAGIGENSVPVFEIDGRQVMPYPSRSLRKKNPVLCYFEVYNLDSADLQDLFEININIEKNSDNKGGIGGFFRRIRGGSKSQLGLKYTRNSDSPDSNELIALDLSELSNGEYTITVAISGPGSEAIAEITKSIKIH